MAEIIKTILWVVLLVACVCLAIPLISILVNFAIPYFNNLVELVSGSYIVIVVLVFIVLPIAVIKLLENL